MRIKKIAHAVAEEFKTYPPVMYPPELMGDNATSITQLLSTYSKLSKTISCTTPSGQWQAYQDCSLVQSIIEKRVEYIRSGVYDIVDDNDESLMPSHGNSRSGTRASEIIHLLNNPNPLQSRDEFEAIVVIYKEIFGFCPLYKVMPANRTTGLPVAIWAINPSIFNYTLTGRMFLQSTLFGIVSSVSFANPSGEMITLNTEEQLDCLWILNGNTPRQTDLFIAQSPLYPCGELINNFQIAVNVYGTLLKQSLLGIISNRTADKMGHQNLDTKTEDALKEKMKTQYGLIEGRDNFVITNKNLFFQSLLTNIDSLKIPECLKISVEELCNRLSFKKELLNNGDITYENKRIAEISQYQSSIIPWSDGYCENLTEFLLPGEAGINIIKCFNDLPILQKNKKEEAEVLSANVTSYDKLWSRGLINKNQYLVGVGLPEVAGGDSEYYKAPEVNNTNQNNNGQETNTGEDTEAE